MSCSGLEDVGEMKTGLSTIPGIQMTPVLVQDSQEPVLHRLDVEPTRNKVPYSHLTSSQIRLYQSYIDRAFELSPTLEFDQDDLRFHKLMTEVADNHSLSELDFEMMRLQYIYADKCVREKYRTRWVEKVMARKTNNFFSDP